MKDLNYKTEHHEIFTASEFDWPISWGEGDGSYDQLVPPDGLYTRERESLLFLHLRFPFNTFKQAEYVEINTSLPRLLQGSVEPDSDYKRFKRSPWRTTPGTLIGSGKVAVRYVDPASQAYVVRLLEPLEYLACIGWDITFCGQHYFSLESLESIPDVNPPFTIASYADLIGDMAGNAWSAYSYAAVRTALMATSGKFVPKTAPIEVSDDTGDAGDVEGKGVKGKDHVLERQDNSEDSSESDSSDSD